MRGPEKLCLDRGGGRRGGNLSRPGRGKQEVWVQDRSAGERGLTGLSWILHSQQCQKGSEPSLQTMPSAQTHRKDCVTRLASKHLLAWVALAVEWALTVTQGDPRRIQPCTMQAQGGLHVHQPDLNCRVTSTVSRGSQVWTKVEGPTLILAFLQSQDIIGQ